MDPRSSRVHRSLIVHTFLRGEANPLAHWEEPFDGADVSGDAARFPPFDEVLATCRAVRARTLTLVDALVEDDLDRPSAPNCWAGTDVGLGYSSEARPIALGWPYPNPC